MKKHILILRQESSEAERYWEKYYYKTEDRGATVATALGSLTWDQLEEKDKTPSASYRPVAWEHSCLQKKCGACAMVIDGIPRLACKTRLAECGETIKVEPLKKFPLVEDLIVDRSAMMDQLKKLSVWFDEEAGTIKLMYDDPIEDTLLYYSIDGDDMTIDYPWPMVKTGSGKDK